MQDRDAGVGILPKRQEILIGRFCLGRLSRQDECTRQLQARESADRIADYDATMIEDPLEFPRRRQRPGRAARYASPRT